VSEPETTCGAGIPLRCHYCGTEMEVVNAYGVERLDCFLRCKFEHCTACGPNSPNLSAAIAAHARVMPVPVWTMEPAKVPGDYYVIDAPGCEPDFDRITARDIERGTFAGSWTYGPITPPPLSAEPAEGGGA